MMRGQEPLLQEHRQDPAYYAYFTEELLASQGLETVIWKQSVLQDLSDISSECPVN